MKTTAAILWAPHSPWSVEEIELDPPKDHEVLVELKASGLCHTDEHLVEGTVTGLLPEPPIIGGHEGAGVVVEVGPGVTGLAPGDHVAFSFTPVCGKCYDCATGHSNLCEVGGAAFPSGMQIGDLTARHHGRGKDLALTCLIGTFAHHTVVHESSLVRIPDTIPMEIACLFGCAVLTGWGSAVYAADVRVGEYVAVVGAGGVGTNAIQGARMAGAKVIAAIDPVEFKRTTAKRFGATHTYASVEEAQADLGEATWNRGYNKVIMTVGVCTADILGSAFNLAGKRGVVVVTNVHPITENSIPVTPLLLTFYEKRLQGATYGSCNPRSDIPRLLESYSSGQLEIESMITKTYSLDEINEGYQDMRDGKNIRGVLVYP